MRCKHCKTKVDKENLYQAGLYYFCDRNHAVQYALDNKDKGKRKIEKEKNKEFNARKREFKLNDLPKQLKLTQQAFNKLRKLQEFEWFKIRGLEPECISCGKTKMDWCCGS